MNDKKGFIEIQFNWIYVAIVGGILLLVFFSIATGIRKSSQDQLEYDATNYFDEIFTSMQGSENTEHSVTLSGLDIEVDTAKTGSDQCNYYRISKSAQQGMSTQYIPLFSPNLIKQRVVSYSLGWDVPFRANYFLYLSSPGMAYVLVDTDQTLFEDLPNNIIKVQGTGKFINQNYYKIRFVYQNKDPESVSASVAKLPDKDVSAIKIIGDNLYGFGTIEYYQKKGSSFVLQGTSYYLDKPTLFAAIYSETYLSYECNLKKAIMRLNKISAMLIQRDDAIKGSDLLPFCSKDPYQTASTYLKDLEQITANDDISMNTIKKINDIKTGFQALNDDLNKKSCPTIY